ncbi:Protein transport protein SEC31 OS=Ustilago maydis (strain 521 / FGSC 9021) GN=SEC31 PE=3 SV=1 [Rhizoctonia solani AG-1 IB]|uniref:Protein transport protein SEC31 n=1 Tax=Thanatephorus cucumeris (strain AG1-IB / isolate 7/3/14) TaxID=1108050 RepID=A0A0B7FU60_THACB|nr:Protein transport protein SEC31 OS=Ustilago maydis (strain 521 / FGSC 9021) GN=SEC31 PE=3 SV=1 [Rhizoctonia solani AG-1 IB]
MEALADPAGGPGPGSGAGGVRRGVSDIAWHPDNATRLITASEDDSQPVIMLWDFRNARAPERILQGHERGVLSVSWCPQDPELLISCGKDNRTLVWNPSSGDILGQLPLQTIGPSSLPGTRATLIHSQLPTTAARSLSTLSNR